MSWIGAIDHVTRRVLPSRLVMVLVKLVAGGSSCCASSRALKASSVSTRLTPRSQNEIPQYLFQGDPYKFLGRTVDPDDASFLIGEDDHRWRCFEDRFHDEQVSLVLLPFRLRASVGQKALDRCTEDIREG